MCPGIFSKSCVRLNSINHLISLRAKMEIHARVLSFLLNFQEELDEKSPLICKLGLLHETGMNVPSAKCRTTYLCFQHKTLQEHSGAFHISRRIIRGVRFFNVRKNHITILGFRSVSLCSDHTTTFTYFVLFCSRRIIFKLLKKLM